MAIDTIRHAVERMLGQTNAQQLKKYEKELRAVNAWIDDVAALSDDALRAKAAEFKQQLEDGVSKSSLRAEVYALVREVAARTIGLRPFDVQILGGFALDDRKIAEMATGEGKTLVATLPATLNALCGKVHVVTVNDYLARRDREWMGPVYEFLELSVGLLQDGMPPDERQVAYQAHITYGTNNQFGFDYLRDNMVHSLDQKVQGPLDFAIVDAIDGSRVLASSLTSQTFSMNGEAPPRWNHLSASSSTQLGANGRNGSRCFTSRLTMSFMSGCCELARMLRCPSARGPTSARP